MTSFSEFFEALWRSDRWPKPEPFPWQAMLAERAAGGDWPQVISLPTASGKTACLDAAVYALAATAGEAAGKRMPRRIWFVVDRRIVVDEAFRRAGGIAARLADAGSAPLKEVADRLRELGGRGRPLRVARLRGGAWRDDTWARLPSQPSIICSTVDQVGSALMFRAYGHSDETASIYAGLAANDSLILLDEAHCAVPFMQTLSAISRFRGGPWAEEPLEAPFRYCIMSATPPGGVPDEAVFPLREQRAIALRHRLLDQRIAARKLAILVPPIKDHEFAPEAAARARSYVAEGARSRVAVMVNRVATAKDVAAMLAKDAAGADVVLLTGRMRPLDRDALIARYEDRLKAGSSAALERPIIVVTTQCLEVGADFSFDALVTECASLDALRQRFGRLDRLGELKESSTTILIHARDAKEPKDGGDPVYGGAIYETWTWLSEPNQLQADGTVDFGIAAMDGRVQALREQDEARFTRLLAPAPDAPVLLPAHLDLLCQTSPHTVPEPDVALFLHGKGRQAREVRVVFRADLADGEDACIETLSLMPPASPEMLSVPLAHFRRWIAGGGAEDREAGGDVEGMEEAADENEMGAARTRFVIWRGRERSVLTDDIRLVRPNDVVVLRLTERDLEGLGQSIADPAGLGPSWCDIAEQAAAQAFGRIFLRIRSDLFGSLCQYPSVGNLAALASTNADQEEIEEEIRAALDAVLAEDRATEPHFLPGWLTETITSLRDGFFIEPHPAGGLVLIGKEPRPRGAVEDDLFSDADDLLSKAGTEISWRDHTDQVRSVAKDFATRCLPAQLSNAIDAAAELHDLGKLDWRFQMLLRDGDEVGVSSGVALAKSITLPERRRRRREMRSDARLPDGFRHESLSLELSEQLRFADENIRHRELVLHLIASHHGHARPFAPVVLDEGASGGRARGLCLDGTGMEKVLSGTVPAGLPAHRPDSGVPERFWRLTRRYGWWGLSYLESLLRLADWEASRNPRIDARCAPFSVSIGPPIRKACGEPISLDALDGANPLAFLAALGTLRLLTRALPEHNVRLSWAQRLGAWRPLLWSMAPLDEAAIVKVLFEKGLDLATMFSEELLAASEAASPKNKKGEAAWKDKLLFPVEDFRRFCSTASEAMPVRLEFAAAWASETAMARGDELARRTRFDFTAGQQAFIGMLRELRTACRPEDLRSALFSGWRYSSAAVSMRWDIQDEKRQYALQAFDPTNGSKNPPMADVGANFLAVEGLPLFPLVPDRQAGQAGFDREGQCWTWPIWDVPLDLDTTRSVLHIRYTKEAWPAWRRCAMGISSIYQSRIVQPSGRYRCFTPARAV